MELSKRLYAVAGLVTEGASVADIGTDHGYIPIYLVKEKRIKKAVAMDINRGPLERAGMHIRSHGLEDIIETRLSDGLKELACGEADTAVIAGMGGALVIQILEGNPDTAGGLKELVLQPQSEIRTVRQYLADSGWKIIDEDMVEEDGKYYPMMKAVHGEPEEYKEQEFRYGRYLLAGRHPVLYRYLNREKELKEGILENLNHSGSLRAGERRKELEQDLFWNSRALAAYRQDTKV